MKRSGLCESMTLLVCESSPRWLPALKVAVAAAAAAKKAGEKNSRTRLRVQALERWPEPAWLAELTTPTAILLEVSEANLPRALRWIRVSRRVPTTVAVGVLDQAFLNQASADQIDTVREALLEAGAARVVRSTLDLPDFLPVVGRHLREAMGVLDAAGSLREAVWRRLPWQPSPAPLR